MMDGFFRGCSDDNGDVDGTFLAANVCAINSWTFIDVNKSSFVSFSFHIPPSFSLYFYTYSHK